MVRARNQKYSFSPSLTWSSRLTLGFCMGHFVLLKVACWRDIELGAMPFGLLQSPLSQIVWEDNWNIISVLWVSQYNAQSFCSIKLIFKWQTLLYLLLDFPVHAFWRRSESLHLIWSTRSTGLGLVLRLYLPNMWQRAKFSSYNIWCLAPRQAQLESSSSNISKTHRDDCAHLHDL